MLRSIFLLFFGIVLLCFLWRAFIFAEMMDSLHLTPLTESPPHDR